MQTTPLAPATFASPHVVDTCPLCSLVPHGVHVGVRWRADGKESSSLMLAAHPATLLLGVPVDDLTMADCLDRIDDLVRDGRAHGRSHQVATVNVDFLVNAVEHDELRALLQSTSMNLADGLPLVWGSRLVGLPVRERVAGADLVPLLAAESERRGWSVHFFGSAPGVVERALDLLRERYPGAQLSGESGPIISDVTDVDDSVLDGIAARGADIVCVALGNPKQEWFISSNLARLGCSVAIGIGGSLDMLVGDRTRAPEWAQKIGAEWLVRAVQEPKRLGPRYARDAFVFAPQLIRYARELRRAGQAAVSVTAHPNGILVAVAHQDAMDHDKLVDDWATGVGPGAGALHLQLGDDRLGARALAQTAVLIRRAQMLRREVNMSPARGPLRLQLGRLDLLAWFDATAERGVG